jgi:hypothetical protein
VQCIGTLLCSLNSVIAVLGLKLTRAFGLEASKACIKEP